MANKRKRSYKGPDWYLMEHSQTLHDLFEDDKAGFSAYDPDFADPFETDWQDAIDAAVNYQDDTAVKADIGIKTGTVAEQMALCRAKYDDVIYFAQKAFGKKGRELKAFGVGKQYTAASRSQGKMRDFMDELHQAAEKHKVKLIAAGFIQPKIDEIATLRDSFTTSNSQQNKLKKDRPEISQGRLDTYNTLYDDFTLKVTDAVQLAYPTNPAKQNQYSYNPPVQHRNTIVRRIKVKKGETGYFDLTHIMDTVDPPSLVEFKAKDSDGAYYAATDVNGLPGAGPVLVVLKGKKKSKTPDELTALLGIGDTKPILKVKNTGNATGTYTVTFRF